MPLYEYRCVECGKVFEHLRRIKDSDRDVVCPHCRSQQVERMLSTFASPSGPVSNCASGKGFG